MRASSLPLWALVFINSAVSFAAGMNGQWGIVGLCFTFSLLLGAAIGLNDSRYY